MKVFISWSGEKSGEVAQSLYDWLKNVFQTVDFYISKENINKGELWSNNLSENLSTSDYGIVCVTKDNLNANWLLFEAGALARRVGDSQMCPFTFDLSVDDLKSPLSLYNGCNNDKEDIFRMVKNINQLNTTNKLDESRMTTTFEKWWEELEQRFAAIKEKYKDKQKQPSKENSKSTTEILLEEQRILLQDIRESISNIQGKNKNVVRIEELLSVGLQTNRKLGFWLESLKEHEENIDENAIGELEYLIHVQRDSMLKAARGWKSTYPLFGND